LSPACIPCIGNTSSKPFSKGFSPSVPFVRLLVFFLLRFAAKYSECSKSLLQPVAKLLQTLYGSKWPVHEPVLVISLHPFIKVASHTRPCSEVGGTALNGKEVSILSHRPVTSSNLKHLVVALVIIPARAV